MHQYDFKSLEADYPIYSYKSCFWTIEWQINKSHDFFFKHAYAFNMLGT